MRLAGRTSLALAPLPVAHTLAGGPEAEGPDIRVAAVAGCCCWSEASAASRSAAACGLSSASCSLLAGMAGFDARLVLSVPGLSGREFNAAPAAAAATMARALGDSSGWSEDLRKWDHARGSSGRAVQSAAPSRTLLLPRCGWATATECWESDTAAEAEASSCPSSGPAGGAGAGGQAGAANSPGALLTRPPPALPALQAACAGCVRGCSLLLLLARPGARG
ncbi:hypothetical protein V8C86DRAFT_1807652 [Haematococcus lacustris]